MTKEPMGNCDVCGEAALGVASSTLGAVSFAYCRECVGSGAEPFNMLATTLALCGGPDNAALWVRASVIPATLSRTGKSEVDLDAAWRAAAAEMAAGEAAAQRVAGEGPGPGAGAGGARAGEAPEGSGEGPAGGGRGG